MLPKQLYDLWDSSKKGVRAFGLQIEAIGPWQPSFSPAGLAKARISIFCATWLWGPGDGWTFDYFRRASGLRRFESATQFGEVAEQLAATAAMEMQELDRNFSSISDIAAHLKAKITENPPTLYSAAVAAGLIEDWDFSRACFQQLVSTNDTHPFWTEVRKDTAPLIAAAGNRTAFQDIVRTRVMRRRAGLSLPPLSGSI